MRKNGESEQLAKLREWEKKQAKWKEKCRRWKAAVELGSDADGRTKENGLTGGRWNSGKKISIRWADFMGKTRPMTIYEEIETVEGLKERRN